MIDTKISDVYILASASIMLVDKGGKIVQKTEATMERISHSGDKKNLDFNKFLVMLIGSYNDIDEYGPQGTNKVPDETKVTKILNNITYPNLAASKTIVLSLSYYSLNFENAKILFLTQISSIKQAAQVNSFFMRKY